MRDYKFRAWITERDEMVYSDGKDENINFVLHDGYFTISIDEYDEYDEPVTRDYDVCDTTMQYTGQHDKNEKGIYEGDLIFIDDVDGTFTVKWNDYSARLEINGDGITADFDNYYGYECEVVGNIYENKELLEGGAE